MDTSVVIPLVTGLASAGAALIGTLVARRTNSRSALVDEMSLRFSVYKDQLDRKQEEVDELRTVNVSLGQQLIDALKVARRQINDAELETLDAFHTAEQGEDANEQRTQARDSDTAAPHRGRRVHRTD